MKLDINFMIKMDAVKTLEVIPDVIDVLPEQILKVPNMLILTNQKK